MAPKFINELRDSVDIPLSLPNRLLCQFTAAGISIYTTNFSRLAHTRYKASTNGERLFSYCLTNLPVFHAADPHLQFGWHENSIWRNFGVHQFEYEHLLLIAAIAECLPEAYAGSVLSYLADDCEEEDRPKPSLAQWTAFARALNGVIITSDFALTLDDRMRLDPYRVTSGHSLSCTNSLIPPADFAQAVRALSDLSLAEAGQLTLVGGNFLGWFAAMAELFLGINVQISSRDGEVLHVFHADSKAWLYLIFVDDVNNLTPTAQSQNSRTPLLKVMCSPDKEASTIPRVPFTGRVAWDSLLPKTFESSFHRIAHQDSKCLVQSIGGLARLFEVLAQDPNTPETLISQENRNNPASLGAGLIQTICNWFPELRHLQGRFERLQKLGVEEAGHKCDEGAQGFVRLCGCTICSAVPYYASEDPGTLPQSFCLLAIMETILNLGLAMSRITVTSKVYPSRAGILCIYQRQVQKLLDAKNMARQGDEAEAYARPIVLFGRDWNANYARRLQNAVAIFSGSWPRNDLPENLVAISHEGICANILGVQHGDRRARRQDADVIRVQAGHVAWKQKAYSRLCFGSPKGISDSDYTWEEIHCDHISQPLYCK